MDESAVKHCFERTVHKTFACCLIARQFYENHRATFVEDEDAQPMVLALQFITHRDEIETSKPVREFRYVSSTCLLVGRASLLIIIIIIITSLTLIEPEVCCSIVKKCVC